MKLFTEDIIKIQEEIKNATAKVEKLKNPDKIRDIIPVINCLNEIIKNIDNDFYNQNITTFNNIDSIPQRIAAYKTLRSYQHNLRKIDQNTPLMLYISNEISKKLAEEQITIDYNLIFRQDYSEEESYAIIKKYYESKNDKESLAIFEYLIRRKAIYDIDPQAGIAALTTNSVILDKSYIFLKNNYDFATIVNLIHEIRHLKEWYHISNIHRLIQYKECNDFAEVASKQEEKEFLEYSSKNQQLREKALNMHYANYQSLRLILEGLKDKKGQIKSFEEAYNLISHTISVYGDIFSDILLSSSQSMQTGFYQSLSKRKNLLLSSWDFNAFGLTTYGACDRVIKQYKKY